MLTLKDKKAALLCVMILLLFPTIIGYFSIFERSINSNLKDIPVIGDFKGSLSWNSLIHTLKTNETFVEGRFEGKAVFGEFHGNISGVFFGRLNDTFLGLLNQTSDLVGEGVLRGYFYDGFFEGRATEATPIPVLASLGFLVVLGVTFLLLRPKTFKEQVQYLQFLMICIIAVGLGTDIWLLRIATSSSIFLVPEFQNFLVFALAPFMMIFLFFAEKVAALFMLKKISEGNKIFFGLHSFAYSAFILFFILIVLHAISTLVYFNSLFESNPFYVQSFGIMTSVNLRSGGLAMVMIWALVLLFVFLNYADALFLNRLKKDRYYERLKQLTEAELKPKLDRLERKTVFAFYLIMVLIVVPLIFNSLLPHRISSFLNYESLLSFFAIGGIIFFGACAVYIFGSGFKSYMRKTSNIENRKILWRHIVKRHFYLSLSATLTLVLLGVVLLVSGYLSEFLFSEYSSAFAENNFIFIISALPLIILGISSIWIYSLVPFYVYSYGWRSAEISAIVFFGSFAIEQLIGAIAPYAFVGLQISLLGSLLSFGLTYVISKHIENYIKSKLQKDA